MIGDLCSGICHAICRVSEVKEADGEAEPPPIGVIHRWGECTDRPYAIFSMIFTLAGKIPACS